jgi:hypothetical protein
VRGVLELAQWTNSALNRRRPGLDCGLRKRCVDGVKKALETVHCPLMVCLQTMRGDNGDQDVFDV